MKKKISFTLKIDQQRREERRNKLKKINLFAHSQNNVRIAAGDISHSEVSASNHLHLQQTQHALKHSLFSHNF
jgi:hypothetical protein